MTGHRLRYFVLGSRNSFDQLFVLQYNVLLHTVFSVAETAVLKHIEVLKLSTTITTFAMHAITYIWLKVIVNVGKYTIHGSCGIVRSLIEINSSKHCRHFTRYLDSSFFLRFPDVWMSGCLLGCFPVGESESAPPFRNLFALHLISLFWQVRVGTLVVRNR